MHVDGPDSLLRSIRSRDESRTILFGVSGPKWQVSPSRIVPQKLNPHGCPRVSPDVWGSVLLWALHVHGTTETTRLGQIAACIGNCKIRKPCSTISQLQAPFIYLKPRPCLSRAGHASDQQHTTRHHERSKLEGNVPQSQQLIAVYRYRHNPSFVHRRHYCEVLSTQDSFQSLETLLSSPSPLRMDERK